MAISYIVKNPYLQYATIDKFNKCVECGHVWEAIKIFDDGHIEFTQVGAYAQCPKCGKRIIAPTATFIEPIGVEYDVRNYRLWQHKYTSIR